MPVPSIRPPGWRLEGTDELENRPNGPKDYNPHDYRDWKQQIAEYEAEGISRPGAILEWEGSLYVAIADPLEVEQRGDLPHLEALCQR